MAAMLVGCCSDSPGQQAPVVPAAAPPGPESSETGAPQAVPPSAPEAGPPAAQRADNVSVGGANTNSNRQSRGTSTDRLFYVLPNFLTLEDAGKVPPLTTEEKFKVVTQSSFDWVKYFWFGALAGIGQAENSPAGYGQGAAGYGKRYGAAFGDSTIEDYMTSAIFPSLLHQDPRYFQLGKGSFWHRTEYAVSRIAVVRSDSGHSQFNFSEIVGAGASASISTFSYYPRRDRTASNVMNVWGEQLGIDTFVIVLKEFWPDIRRKLHNSRSGQGQSPSGQASSVK